MKLEYLMLAHTFKPAKHNIAGWFVSEKLDGSRAFWDGGISRGLLANEVPYANCVKDDRLINPVVATGLWSRSGKVIHAPDYFLDSLPHCFLDGELFIDRGCFQELRKVIGDHNPGPGWRSVRFMVFDSPSWSEFGCDREIKIRSEYSFYIDGTESWIKEANYNHPNGLEQPQRTWTFEHVLIWLQKRCVTQKCILLDQERLPFDYHNAVKRMETKLEEVLALGGEGLILRNPVFRWFPKRSYSLLKHKPHNDAEGKIIGFTTGRETNRGSKLLGMIGALVLNFNGKRLELSGLTDEERTFETKEMVQWAQENPAKEAPSEFQGKHFKIGESVTFKYRELSDDGVPKEARYYRKRT